MRKILLILLLSVFAAASAQTDTVHYIRLHFLYGSKPLWKTRKTEPRFFGGLHGGHVSIEVDSVDYGFHPHKKLHIFSHRRNHHSVFSGEKVQNGQRYRSDAKVATVLIPITQAQYDTLNSVHRCYCGKTPYDYAFFGMRCAAASQDILSQTGLVDRRGRIRTIFTTFYPKLLRKRVLKLAQVKNYTILRQQGRPTRRWEKD